MTSFERSKRSIINIVLALFSQIATVLVGMVLPRALMVNYGSETNGLVTSLQQVISYLTLIEGGLLSTVAVSLYKPLADKDVKRVNQVLYSAKYFYGKTGALFCIALIVVAFIYPLTIAETEYSYIQILIMVFLIGFNGATQILFIGKYKALLMASQMNGMILAINSLSTVLYSGLLIIGAYAHFDLLVALSVAIFAYLVRAALFYFAVRKFLPQYCYNQKCNIITFPQRGDAFASQILTMISLNGGVIVLSFIKAPMSQISVYTTYNLVLSGLYMLMYSIENSVTSTFGDIMASESHDYIKTAYTRFDIIYHIVWSVVVGCLASLLLPFIKIYTYGVKDAQYILPFESAMFVVIGALWMLRNQETLLMTAKGNFKDMRRSMAVEAAVVILGGVVGYRLAGLKGMLLAKVLSVIYMAISLMKYTYIDILHIGVIKKIRSILISCTAILATYLCCFEIQKAFVIRNLLQWIVLACICGVIAVMVSFFAFWLFDKQALKPLVIKVMSKNKREGI